MLESVCHDLDEMSLIKRIEDTDLGHEQRNLLNRFAKKKKNKLPKAHEVDDAFVVEVGENTAESEVAHTKQQLRRVNQLGHVSPLMLHVRSLAGRRLLLQPGLGSVSKAFKLYREVRRNVVGNARKTSSTLAKAAGLFQW